MKIFPVISSNIAAIGYDPSVKRLRIYFGKDGQVNGIYHYEGVAAALVGELLFAPSAGSFFSQCIKSAYSGAKLEGEEFEAAMSEVDLGAGAPA